MIESGLREHVHSGRVKGGLAGALSPYAALFFVKFFSFFASPNNKLVYWNFLHPSQVWILAPSLCVQRHAVVVVPQ
jgi:threonine/homoserine/homoserine lactone efflux protein